MGKKIVVPRRKDLTLLELSDIKREYINGATITFLSEKYKRDYATICRVLKRMFSDKARQEIINSRKQGTHIETEYQVVIGLLKKILKNMEQK